MSRFTPEEVLALRKTLVDMGHNGLDLEGETFDGSLQAALRDHYDVNVVDGTTLEIPQDAAGLHPSILERMGAAVTGFAGRVEAKVEDAIEAVEAEATAIVGAVEEEVEEIKTAVEDLVSDEEEAVEGDEEEVDLEKDDEDDLGDEK